MNGVADTILMIRPAAFGYNDETAANNHFQFQTGLTGTALQQGALQQFDAMVALLQTEGIKVVVIEDTVEPAKPDAVFPNNWFTANNSRLTIFPMFAATRRVEKRADIIATLAQKFSVTNIEDWSEYEAAGQFLEGTGSMVIDHPNQKVYACCSPRTDSDLVRKYAEAIGYDAILFAAQDAAGRAIYHTNVMLCIGEDFAVICLDAINDNVEREKVEGALIEAGHSIIAITQEQMAAFAGNMLQLKNKKGDRFTVLSQTAYAVLEPEQQQHLEAHGKLLPIDVSVIEQEGGSVRCMIAEILLEPQK